MSPSAAEVAEHRTAILALVNTGLLDGCLSELNVAIYDRIRALAAMANLRTVGKFVVAQIVRLDGFDSAKGRGLNGSTARITKISYRGSRGGTASVVVLDGPHRNQAWNLGPSHFREISQVQA